MTHRRKTGARRRTSLLSDVILATLLTFAALWTTGCYKATLAPSEENLESTLNVFFDETADRNLDVGALFSLGAGLAVMLEKLALRHGFPELKPPA